eukprot:TRINITY_DN13834_c0_g1_i1.p1 TRINITY_DN13834_c0_g1~~TRINITY_DN13834_c0_g1_i1.p1  ORF type:complete len:580 (+),score=141.52 TRINITY_DN13834_c0_g1_i1:76-1740(+)
MPDPARRGDARLTAAGPLSSPHPRASVAVPAAQRQDESCLSSELTRSDRGGSSGALSVVTTPRTPLSGGLGLATAASGLDEDSGPRTPPTQDLLRPPPRSLPPGRYCVTRAANCPEAEALTEFVTVSDACVLWESSGEEVPLRRTRDGVRMRGTRLRVGQRVTVARSVHFREGETLRPGDLATITMVFYGDMPAHGCRPLKVGDSVRQCDGGVISAPDADGVPGAWKLPKDATATVSKLERKGTRIRLQNADGLVSCWMRRSTFQHADGAPIESPNAAELHADAVRGQPEFHFNCNASTIDRSVWIVREGGRGLVKWSDGDTWRRLSDAIEVDDDAHAVYCNIYRIPAAGRLAELGSLTGFTCYHSGVEVCGMEWWFGGAYDAERPELPGVECCPPGQCTIGEHMFRVHVGETKMTAAQTSELARVLADGEWKKGSYHLLQRNCNHFTDAFLASLGVDASLPPWVNRVARWGSALVPTKLYDRVAREQGAQQRWDESAKELCWCGARYTMLNRRHHCRACGRMFCGRCTAGRRVLPMHGPNPVRVCDDCVKSPI